MDKKRIIIALSIGAVLITLFTALSCSNPFGLIGMLLFAGFGTWEFYGLLNAGGVDISKKWGTASGLVFIVATWFHMTGQVSNNLLWCILLLIIASNFFRILAYQDLRKGLAVEYLTQTEITVDDIAACDSSDITHRLPAVLHGTSGKKRKACDTPKTD